MTYPSTTARDVTGAGSFRGARALARSAVVGAALFLLAGCAAGPRVLGPDERRPIDRSLVESPAGFDAEVYATGLSGPVAMTFDADGNTLVAEGGTDADEPRVYGFTAAGQRFDIYPVDKPLLPFVRRGFRMYGPVGGLLFHEGWVYVSHRDEGGQGVITALDYRGNHRTIVAGLPARGENGATGMAVHPTSRRLFFGMGNATNSGLVGLDNFAQGWVKRHPDAHDVPYTPERELTLWGRKMTTPNPAATWFAPDVVPTGPYQAFAQNNRTRIKGATAADPKCNSAILSCRLDGGDLQVEAHGVRNPRGLAFNDFRRLLFTNQGMEARGSRPVNDDPDVLNELTSGAPPAATWYGFPDFTSDLKPVTDRRFQPPLALILGSGYDNLSFLIDHGTSGLADPRATVPRAVAGAFPSQSGASGVAIVPSTGPFREWAGSAVVALFGDRSPFATGGQKLAGPVGFKVVRVRVEGGGQVLDFVKNVRPGPASALGGDPRQLERPIDVKFGPDGALYVLDFGEVRVRDGRLDVRVGSGRIYRLLPTRGPGAAAGR